jgi:hypothetical protein
MSNLRNNLSKWHSKFIRRLGMCVKERFYAPEMHEFKFTKYTGIRYVVNGGHNFNYWRSTKRYKIVKNRFVIARGNMATRSIVCRKGFI